MVDNQNPIQDPETKAKNSCLARGGKWIDGTCLMPEGEEDLTDPSRPSQNPNVKNTPAEPLKPAKTFNIGDAAVPNGVREVNKAEFEATRESLGGAQGNIIAGQPREDINSEKIQSLKANLDPRVAQQAAIDTERQRISDEEAPERRELGTEGGFGEKIPLIGGAVRFGRQNIGGPLKDLLGIERSQPHLELTPEELRTAALTEIERIEIERGLTASETFGAFVESLQLGPLSDFVAEKPSENAREVFSNIRKERRRIANIETNVKTGYLPVGDAQDQITDIENNVQRLESRLRLLLANSPEFNFNSDGVNTMETEILLTKEKIFQGKQNILTGQTTDANELQLLQTLQALQVEEE